MNKAILKAALEKTQDELIQELCGPKYNRGEPRNYRRAGTAKRTLVTRHGTIELRLVKVRSLENGAILRPLLLYIGVEPRKRIVDDLIMECAETATYLTYRDPKTIIEDLTKARISRHRIHSSVQRIGAYVEEERGKKAKEKVDLMIGDGTKAHGMGKKNEINVVLGKDLETGEKSLLGLTVNRSWGETAGQVTATADVLISDADRAMRNALIDKALSHQLCVNHAVGEVNTHLWRAGLPRRERKEIRARLRTILRTCRNSAMKHLKDGDTERLQWRIDETLRELKELAQELMEEGLTAAAKFLRNSVNYLVTYARLAMKQIHVPYTNNLMERLMGEVAKRVKNRWMHWSTEGLENLLNILLVRYCDRRLYATLKQKYYKDENTVIMVKIT